MKKQAKEDCHDSYEDHAKTVIAWWHDALKTCNAVWWTGVMGGTMLRECHESLQVIFSRA